MKEKQDSMVATTTDDSTSSSQSPSPPCTPPPSNKSNDNNDLDQIVPTAIVIKNIPFSIKRDALLGLLDIQSVPQPYAMNYHFDNGVFRGLAFANYRTHELALEATQLINKITINGRQLRAEFKRMLPSNHTGAEKEDERKKENELEVSLRQLAIGNGNDTNTIIPTTIHEGRRGNGGNRRGLQSDDVRQQLSGPSRHIINGVDINNDLDSLDLDDPLVQGLVKKMKQFKESDEEELVIPNLNGKRRRDAHIIAGSLGLGHFAEGVYPVRFMHVTKDPADTLKSSLYQNPSDQQQQGEGPSSSSSQPPSSSREGQRRSLINLNTSSSSISSGNNNNNNNSSNEFASIIRPIRQPRGPEPDRNFETRKHFAHLGRHATCVCHTPEVKI
ncbi:hypothetical protein BDA99DRAFT_522409 [Phascolomyces articulosus]|uniref:RRM domain-containing protein n=1 Tax=Phascolomyces articulosus TaxID=60185 RepID=A0AAD5JRJ8_9FUNG|nr:hypothetical protein BDA99DRAFT_522409 [Phascolomyces articulosus]